MVEVKLLKLFFEQNNYDVQKKVKELDEKVMGLFNQTGAKHIRTYNDETLITRLFEYENQGAIEYVHNLEGDVINIVGDEPSLDNDFLKFNEFFSLSKNKEDLLVTGYLLFLGFNEKSPSFSSLKNICDVNLKCYDIKNVCETFFEKELFNH